MMLVSQLYTLENGGLIRLAQTQPELEYLFRHALVQDAAYQSLVKNDRRQLHRAVGEALERTQADRLAELAPLLAQHFDAAGDEPRALRYYTLAGDQAARQYANVEAAAHYGRALELAQHAPGVERDSLMHLYFGRGRTLRLSSRHAEALANYAEMEALARERGDLAMELAALMERATIHLTPTPLQDHALGRELMERALRRARDIGDRAAEARIQWNLMLGELFGGNAQRGVEHGEQSLALARELNLREQWAATLSDLSVGYVFVGQTQRGWQAMREAQAMWRELNNLPMLADNLSNFALTSFYLNRFDEAMAHAEEALRISRSIANRWGQSHAHGMLGYACQEVGRWQAALDTWEASVEIGAQAGLVSTQIGIRADLAWLYGGELGAVERGLGLARLADEYGERAFPIWRPWTAAVLARLLIRAGDVDEAERVLTVGLNQSGEDYFTRLLLSGAAAVRLAQAEVALARGDPARAVECADDLADHLRSFGVRVFVSDALAFKGKALMAVGRGDEAAQALREARAEAEAIGSRRSLWPILIGLSEIEARRGNQAEADALRGQAREVIEYLAAHIGSAELRASFLDRAEVREVMG